MCLATVFACQLAAYAMHSRFIWLILLLLCCLALSCFPATADCAPGLYKNETGSCVPCAEGQYCLGGDATNTDSAASDCPTGLATVFAGAKSQAQCFTTQGYGRVATRGANGKVELSGSLCGVGLYNVGGNTAGCQRCGAGLTTSGQGSSSTSQCCEYHCLAADRGSRNSI